MSGALAALVQAFEAFAFLDELDGKHEADADEHGSGDTDCQPTLQDRRRQVAATRGAAVQADAVTRLGDVQDDRAKQQWDREDE